MTRHIALASNVANLLVFRACIGQSTNFNKTSVASRAHS